MGGVQVASGGRSSASGGGGECAGGGAGAAGTMARRTRGPQSKQSVPSSQLSNVASGPPSSQYESDANLGDLGHKLLHNVIEAGGGGGGYTGGSNANGGSQWGGGGGGGSYNAGTSQSNTNLGSSSVGSLTVTKIA